MTRQSDQSPEGRDRSGGLDAKHAGGGDAQRQAPTPCFTTPNPILEGVELREAYARVIDPHANWDGSKGRRNNEGELHRRRQVALVKADAIIALSTVQDGSVREEVASEEAVCSDCETDLDAEGRCDVCEGQFGVGA